MSSYHALDDKSMKAQLSCFLKCWEDRFDEMRNKSMTTGITAQNCMLVRKSYFDKAGIH